MPRPVPPSHDAGAPRRPAGALARGSPGERRRRLRAATRRAGAREGQEAQRRHARRLHRLRLRPVPGAEPGQDGPLAADLAVPRGRHLHRRRLPRLPQPDLPGRDLGQHPARQGLAAAADHPRPAGVVPAAVPALQGRPQISPSRTPTGATATAPQQGPPRRTSPSPRRPRWASRRAARSGTTSRASTSQHRVPRVGAVVPQRLDPADPRARLRLRRLLQRRLGDQGPRRRPGHPPDGVRPPGPDLDRPLGRHREHQHAVHPQRRLEAARADQAVPGRPQRDLGRRHDQHRPQLPRPRPGLGRRPRDLLRRHRRPSYGFTRAPSADRRRGRRRPARSRPCSACSRSRASTPAGSTAARPAGGRRGQRLAEQARHAGAAGLVASQLGVPAERGRHPGREVRLHRPRRTPRAAGTLVAGTDATAKAVRATGVFDAKTDKALRAWQKRVGVAVSGVAAGADLGRAPGRQGQR